jgi:hypothetical protein
MEAAQLIETAWIDVGSPGALALAVKTVRSPASRPAVTRVLQKVLEDDPTLALLLYRRGELHDATLIKHIAEGLYEEQVGRIDATSERALRILAMLPKTTSGERAAIWGTILARSPKEDLTTLGGTACQLLSEGDARLATAVMISDMGREDSTRLQAVRVSDAAMRERDGYAMLTAAYMMRKRLEGLHDQEQP